MTQPLSYLTSFVAEATPAQPAPIDVNVVPDLYTKIGAVGVFVTALGVIVALWVAINTERSFNKEREDRLTAQARKVQCVKQRNTIFGDTVWTVTVTNTSGGAIKNLSVEVVAVDNHGKTVEGGCAEVILNLAGTTLQKAITDALIQNFTERGVIKDVANSEVEEYMSVRHFPYIIMTSVESAFVQADVQASIMQSMVGQFFTAWPTELGPAQYSKRTLRTTDPTHTLRVTMRFEDEADMHWERIDEAQPRIFKGLVARLLRALSNDPLKRI